MAVGIVVGEAVGTGFAAANVGMTVAIWFGAVIGDGVSVAPLHASTVIASAVIREINTRLFISFTGVLTPFLREAEYNHRIVNRSQAG